MSALIACALELEQHLSQRTLFELELERVRLLAMAAATRASLGELSPELERRIADIDAHGGLADRGLADRLGLSRDELGLLWCVVAASCDPLLAPHLDALPQRIGRTGCSVSQAASIAGLDPTSARDLALRMTRGNSLTRLGLIRGGDGWTTPQTGWVASPRLISFLSGDDDLDGGFATVARIVEPPHDHLLAPGLAPIAARIFELAIADRPAAILIQGPPDSGRRNLAAVAARRTVIALDLARVRHGAAAVAEALAALAIETMLADALPLIAGLHELAGQDAETIAQRREVARFVDAAPTAVFLVCDWRSPTLELSRPLVRFEIEV